MMKRQLVLGTLIALGALTLTVDAVQQPPQPQQKMVVEVEKLKDNLFVLRGGGGNTTLFVHSDGVTVVDTKLPGWGQPLMAKIKELTNKPVVRIINTHTHGDHVSGNVEFADNVDIVTHVSTAENMKEMRPVTGLGNAPVNVFKEHNGKGLPKRTFKDTMTIGSGADRVELHYFGRGHTNGDAWVLFPAARVLAAGDIFLGKMLPIVDYNNGGSGVDLPDSLMKAYTFASKTADQVVTGHSTVMTPNDIREFSEFNRDFLEYVRAGKKAGKTAEQMAKEWTMPAKYQGFGPAQPARLQGNIDTIAKEIN